MERTQRLSPEEEAQSRRPPDTVGARRIGPYQLIQELGRGANGVVYLGRRAGSEEPVAVKVLLAQQDEETVARFRREAATTSRLQAPGIVRTLDFGQDGGRLYYVMEHCRGVTLKERLRQGALPAQVAAGIVADLAESVSAAHQWGVIHRDLKPSNVLIDGDNRPQVTDFGLARDYAQQRMTRTGDVLGTPVYMAPEQIRGKSGLDHRVDIYALGVILYELLAGRVPFYASDLPTLARQIESGRVTPLRELNPSIPEGLVAVCARAMAVNRDDRYPTATAFAAALSEFRGEANAPLAGSLASSREEGGAVPFWAYFALVAALLSSVGFLVLLVRGAPEPSAASPAAAQPEALAAALSQARAAECERILLEVGLQRQEGVGTATLVRQLGRALQLAEGEQAAQAEALLLEIEAEARRLADARVALETLERENERLLPAPRIRAALDAFVAEHPATALPEDLRERLDLLKKRLAGREVLATLIATLGESPSLQQFAQLLEKAREWSSYNRSLAQETNQEALKVVDKLLATEPDQPAYLILRGLILFRLDKQDQAAECWRAAIPVLGHGGRRVVHEFEESGLMSATELDALRAVFRGHERGPGPPGR